MAKQIFAPKPDAAAEWVFYPNAKTKKDYPAAELEFVGMECQEGEIVSLKPKSQKMLGDTLIIDVAEGRVELIGFESNWQEGEFDEDAIIWDVDRMIEAWSSDD
jgi:hypothetical protein